MSDPLASPACPRCDQAGYIVRPQGRFAQAEICACRQTCPRCKGSGRVTIEVEGHPRVARCRCQRIPDRLVLFNRAQIPRRHHASSFQSFDPSPLGARPGWIASKNWATNYRPGNTHRGLVLYGGVGRGKTHLMVAVLRHLIFEKGVTVRFVEFSLLLAALKEGFDAGRGESRILGPLSQVEVLALDELGKGRNTDWELAIADELISTRYNIMRPILATTNYEARKASGRALRKSGPGNLSQPGVAPTLEDRVGPRVYSRLREMAQFQPAMGEDYRIVGRR